ncbi:MULTISPECIES: hypothetical protein [unclassified Streptococcus]|uniref:hypothetical protein n=1 Tax=unclassified Streptococcus TaxID=2608887 RepID=UPI00359D957E
MRRTKLAIISILAFIIFLILLPLLAEMNIMGVLFKYLKLYFSSDSNKDYFEVVLSAIAIFTTFILFDWQNTIESHNKQLERKEEKEKQEKLYLEQRERERAFLRPLFLAELQGKNSAIRLFIRESAPLTNITIYYQNIANENFQEKFVGNAVSGDCIFRFDSDKLESAIIECRTYLDENIYFQYHVGNNLLHYRIVDGEDLNYIREILKRRILNDSIENNLSHMIEIYNIQLQHSVYESLFFNKFIDFFSSHTQYWITSKEDKLFKLSVILGENNIETSLSRSIGLDSKEDYAQTPEIFFELLEVINKYLKDCWYTSCEEAEQERDYFISNIRNYQGTEIGSYIERFENEMINRELMTQYIDDLIMYLQNSKKWLIFLLGVLKSI